MRDRLAGGKSQRASRLGHGGPSPGHLARSGRPSLVTAAIFARHSISRCPPSMALRHRPNHPRPGHPCPGVRSLRSATGASVDLTRGRPPGGHTVFGNFLPRQKVTRASQKRPFDSEKVLGRGTSKQTGFLRMAFASASPLRSRATRQPPNKTAQSDRATASASA